MKVLFVTWDGPQISYLESFFVSVFQHLKNQGITVDVIQFTWADKERIEWIGKLCASKDIAYRAVKIYRSPKQLGVLLTLVKGIFFVRRYLREHSIDVLLPRSILPGFICDRARRGEQQVAMIFDADGLPYDERVEFSGWQAESLQYRLLRDMEAQLVRRSRHVFTRSEKACEILQNRAGASVGLSRFHVLKNGRDADLFTLQPASARIAVRQQFGWAPDTPLLLYVGSLGNQYCEKEMIAFFTAVHNLCLETRWLILTGDVDRGQQLRSKLGPLQPCVMVDSVRPDQVPLYIAAADLGFALRKTGFSMQAVAPLKIAEYLLCGTPALVAPGTGDSGKQLNDSVSYTLAMNSPEAMTGAASWFVEKVLTQREAFRQACRECGLQHFNLASTVRVYENVLTAVGLNRPDR